MKIDIFTYHDALRAHLEKDLKFLKVNAYRTLDSKEIHESFQGKVLKKSIGLTFDDGRISCWKVLFPLLKSHGCKAIMFIVPGYVGKEELRRNNDTVLTSPECGMDRYCSWEELREMAKSGLVDIQSHSMEHELVFPSDKLIDFQRPSEAGNPLYPQWFSAENPGWGRPIYECAWKGALDEEYIPDDSAEMKCMEYVSRNGGLAFFRDNGWWKKLQMEHERNFRQGKMKRIDFEREEYLKRSVTQARDLIFEKLGIVSRFFAAPVHSYDPLVISVLKQEGFNGLFNGGGESRIDQDGFAIFGRRRNGAPRRLAGKGRETILGRIIKRIRNAG